MARGGYRDAGNQPPGGPGKNSRRTDGNDPSRRVPNVGESDLQYGDRQKLEAGLRTQPLPRTERARAPRPTPSRRSGAQGRGAHPLELIAKVGSARPNEPGTAGLPVGPGAGPEVLRPEPAQEPYEQVLQYFAAKYRLKGATEAIEARKKLQAAPAVPSARPPTQGAPPQAVAPSAAPTEMEAEPTEDVPPVEDDIDAFLGEDTEVV